MTPRQTQSINNFWSEIRRRERDIEENGHRPCPWDVDDRWDFELEDAYEAIHPLLVCISKPQIFFAVSSLLHLRGPFAADNAHQGLMLQHNPQGAMFGGPSHLGSENYLRLRKLGETEVERLGRMDAIPVAVPIKPRVGCEVWNEDFVPGWEVPTKSTDLPDAVVEVIEKPIPSNRNRRSKDPQGFSDDAVVFLAFLMELHKCYTGKPNFTPAENQTWIAQQLSTRGKVWNATRVSRAMGELMHDVKRFGHLKATTRYRRLCEAEEICDELIQISLKPLKNGLKALGVENLDQFQARGFLKPD